MSIETAEDLLREYNFLNLPTGAVTPVNGVTTLSFTFLTGLSQLQNLDYGTYSSNYYGSTSEEGGNFRALGDQGDVILDIFRLQNLSSYSVYLGDVANIQFSSQSNGAITFGVNDGSSSLYVDNDEAAATWLYHPTNGVSIGRHGDVWFNEDFSGGWGGFSRGTQQRSIVLHEILHATASFDEAGNVFTGEENTQQYTVMSYVPSGWNGNGTPTTNALYYDSSTPLYAYGLGLYDIAALQSVYGTNTATRNSTSTYNLANMGRDNDASKAFLYTIWDGGGTDTIDASGFNAIGGVKIDLREGYFSSIGSNGNGQNGYDVGAGREIQNVAIAYGAIIENATGTSNDDYLIGNEYNNTLTGGDGNDILDGREGENSLSGGSGNVRSLANDNVKGLPRRSFLSSEALAQEDSEGGNGSRRATCPPKLVERRRSYKLAA